jgi:hypothetical protein
VVHLKVVCEGDDGSALAALVGVQALYSIEDRATSRAYGELEALQSALPNKPDRLFDDVKPSDLQR